MTNVGAHLNDKLTRNILQTYPYKVRCEIHNHKSSKKSNATKLASTHNEQYKPNYSDNGLSFILKGKIPRTSINNWRIEF